MFILGGLIEGISVKKKDSDEITLKFVGSVTLVPKRLDLQHKVWNCAPLSEEMADERKLYGEGNS
jgi:hypothetical protein